MESLEPSLAAASAEVSESAVVPDGAGRSGIADQLQQAQGHTVVQQASGASCPRAYIREAMGYGRAVPSDPDVEALSSTINGHLQALTQDAVEHLLSVKQRMLAALDAAVTDEHEVGSAKLQAKQAEVDMLSGEVQQLQKHLGRASMYMDRLSDGFALKHQAIQDGKSLLIAWFTWRQHISRQRRLARQWVRAEQYYVQSWLLGRAWNRWAGRAKTRYRQLTAQRAEQQRQVELAALNTTHEQELSDLTGQIDALQQQLQQEAEARNKMEEEMKRAFMRGVTAINLEAVQIMRRGAPPSGANPFPVTLPLNANTAAAGLAAAVQQRQQQEQQLGQQEQQQAEGYVVTPAPAVSTAPAAMEAAAGPTVGQPAGAAAAAAPLADGPTLPSSNATGTASPRHVYAVHPVMRPVGALPNGVAGSPVRGSPRQLPDGSWVGTSQDATVSVVQATQATRGGLPTVVVERGPAAGTHSRLAQASGNNATGRVAGAVSQTAAGRPAGRGLGGRAGQAAGHRH